MKKKNSKKNTKKKDNRYLIIGIVYLVCSVFWFVGGVMKKGANIDLYYIDFIGCILLIILGILYLIKNKHFK